MQEPPRSALRRIVAMQPWPQPPLIRVRYPVLLMHGFGILAGIGRSGHLHEEAMDLRRYCVPAYAPNVAPYNTVPYRAALWKSRIEQVLEETGAEKVNLIAHSMGGLDARYLISRLGMHPYVGGLVTLSTPHHGSPIARFILEQPEAFTRLVNDVCNWIGTTAFSECASDFLTTVRELTREHLEQRFNPDTPDHPDVLYWSYAGQAGKGAQTVINPFLRLFHKIIYDREGPNDGFVSVESAQWGVFKGIVEADHARQIGFQMAPGAGGYKSRPFFRTVVRSLAAEGL